MYENYLRHHFETCHKILVEILKAFNAQTFLFKFLFNKTEREYLHENRKRGFSREMN
jgi:hypothetical protein